MWRAKLHVIIGRVTVIFIFGELNLLGLFPYKAISTTHRLIQSRWKRATSVAAALCGGSFYLYSCSQLLSDPRLAPLYKGISFYTIILWNTSGFLLVISFYGFQIVRGHKLVNLIDLIHDRYKTFSDFYSHSSISMFLLDYRNPEAIYEVKHVYLPTFFKSVVCHLTVIVQKVLMAYFLVLSYPGSSLPMLMFTILYPYLIMASSSSYILLGLRKNAFLYVAMKRKLEKVYDEVRDLCQDTSEKSSYAKMKRFCELSDLVDRLSLRFNDITYIVTKLTETYHFHMVLIVYYTISQNLTLMFLLYRGLSTYVMTGVHPFDVRFYVAGFSFIFLVLFEILLIIISVDEALLQFKDVLKQVHLINYWQQKFDCRLRQSLENFSETAANNQLKVTLFRMTDVNLPMTLRIFDTTLSYFLILIQFDVAYKRGYGFY